MRSVQRERTDPGSAGPRRGWSNCVRSRSCEPKAKAYALQHQEDRRGVSSRRSRDRQGLLTPHQQGERRAPAPATRGREAWLEADGQEARRTLTRGASGLRERLGLDRVELLLADRAVVQELLGRLDLARGPAFAGGLADVLVELGLCHLSVLGPSLGHPGVVDDQVGQDT